MTEEEKKEMHRQTIIGYFLSIMATIVTAGILTIVTLSYNLYSEFNEYKTQQAYWQGTVTQRLSNVDRKIEDHIKDFEREMRDN